MRVTDYRENISNYIHSCNVSDLPENIREHPASEFVLAVLL